MVVHSYAGSFYFCSDYAGSAYAGSDYAGSDYAGSDYAGLDYAGSALIYWFILFLFILCWLRSAQGPEEEDLLHPLLLRRLCPLGPVLVAIGRLQRRRRAVAASADK